MSKKIINISVIVIMSMFITGCASLAKPKPQDIKLHKAEQVKEKKVTFNFPEINKLSGEKIEFNLNDLLSSKYDSSFLGMIYNFQKDDLKYEMNKLTNYKRVSFKNSGERGGLRLEFKEGKIVFIYERGSWVGQRARYTQSIFPLSYKQLSFNEVVFTLPYVYNYRPSKNLFRDVKPLDTKANIETDFLNIFNKLDNILITLRLKYKLTGEINIDYPASSVYANFERKLGLYSKGSNKKSSALNNTFNLKIDEKTYPLQVEVYPYKNGSKIVYNTHIDYYIDSKGVYTLSKQKIDKLHDMIKKVAND